MSNARINKSYIAFAIFVALSFIFWVGKELGKSYEINVPVNVNYQNFPEDKVLANQLTNQLEVFIKSDGYTVLGHYFNLIDNTITIDFNKSTDYNYITGKELNNQILAQFKDVFITYINPDTLYFDFDDAITKKIPIKLNSQFKLAQQYAIKGDYSLFPDSVTVKGPKKFIDTLNFWPTDVVKIQDLDKSINNTISLHTPPLASVSLNQHIIRYEVQVERLTEQTVENLPILIQSPEIESFVKLIPDKASVTFQAFITDLPSISAEQFVVAANFTNISLTEQTKVPLQILEHPQNVQYLYVSPNVCDFILTKQ